MSISEIIHHDWDDGHTDVPVGRDGTRAELHSQLPEFLQKLYESLEPHTRVLIEQRLVLQPALAAASTEMHAAEMEHCLIIGHNIVHGGVDPVVLNTAAARLNSAGMSYHDVIARIIDVETNLHDAGVPSLPFLWSSQRLDGQALG